MVQLRRIALMGGLLIGACTFQAEFDFGVPQFSQVLHPVLIAFAAGLALVTARMWIGPGGALGAAVFFLVVRGGIAVLVGPVLGEATPNMPLFLGEAACVELVALVIARERPIALGAAAGLAIGTVGFFTEYAWTHVFMPLPWNEALLPEGAALRRCRRGRRRQSSARCWPPGCAASCRGRRWPAPPSPPRSLRSPRSWPTAS